MSGKATGWVLKNYPVTCSADRTRKLVLLSVADAANQYGDYARPTLGAVCTEWAFDKSTVIRHLNGLVEDGWLDVLEQGRGRGHATVYSLPRMVAQNHRSEEKGCAIEPERLQDAEGKVAEPQPLTYSSTVEIHGNENGIREPSPVDAVFAAWKQSTGRNGNTRLTPERRKLILAALKNYPVADVIDAVRGWQHSAFHSGQNEQRTVYNDINHCLRDGGRIEQFRDFARGAAPQPESPEFASLRRIREREGRA